jgi:hypothetical protein
MDTTEKKKKPKTSNAPKMRDKLKSQHNEELFTENSVITENSTKNLPAETAISSLTMEKSLIPWFRITLHIIEIFFSLVVVGYYLLPFLPGTSQLEHFLLKKLVPISLYTGPMDDGLGIFFGVFSLICYYGIPILAVWKIFSVFFTKKLVYLCHPEKIPPMVLNILLSALVIAFILFDVINNASNIGYFFTLAPVTYTFFGLAFAHNLTFVLTLINSFNKKNPVYKEYTEFKKIVNTKKKSGVFKFIVKSGIQRKLLFAFIGLILLVISVLSLTLMSQFKKTVETLIIQNGRALVERSASVIKTNLGDNIAISEYFNLEKKKNESASVKFNSLSFFFKDSASINFFAANSTDESIAGKELKENYKALTDTKTAHDTCYIKP